MNPYLLIVKPIRPITIRTADGTTLAATKVGSITPDTSSSLLCIPSVLHVPYVSINLLFISPLTAAGYLVTRGGKTLPDPLTRP